MSPQRDWFTIFDELKGYNILMGRDTSCKTIGVGSVQIRMYDDIIHTLISIKYHTKSW